MESSKKNPKPWRVPGGGKKQRDRSPGTDSGPKVKAIKPDGVRSHCDVLPFSKCCQINKKTADLMLRFT
jgi:hypothetical protein